MFKGFDKLSDTRKLGAKFNLMLIKNGSYVPSQDEMEMYHAVYDAVINHEMTYTSSVFDHVMGILGDKFPEDKKTLAVNRVENGYIGMIVYYMRKVVDANKEHNERMANVAALKDPNINIGMKIKQVEHLFVKYSTMELANIDEENGMLSFLCSRQGTRLVTAHKLPATHPLVQNHIKLAA